MDQTQHSQANISFNNRTQSNNETRSDLLFTNSTATLQSDIQLSRAGSTVHARRTIDDFLGQQNSASQQAMMQRQMNNSQMEGFGQAD